MLEFFFFQVLVILYLGSFKMKSFDSWMEIAFVWKIKVTEIKNENCWPK